MSVRATRHTEHRSELHARRPSEDRETGRALVPTGEPEASSAEGAEATEVGVHPIAVETALAAALWFIAVVWVAFAAGPEIDYLPVIVTLFFMMFFTLFLLTASYSVKDPRWPSRTMRLREFLRSKVAIGSSTMSGRSHRVALIPVALAFAATLIGLAWVIFG
jgi:hypothetical protein